MPAGRFHWGEVLESFLGQPPLAGFPVLVDGSGLSGVELVTSDAHQSLPLRKQGGLKNAIAVVFAGVG